MRVEGAVDGDEGRGDDAGVVCVGTRGWLGLVDRAVGLAGLEGVGQCRTSE